MSLELTTENENTLLDLIGIYGENFLIKYISEIALNKEVRLQEHLQN